jgi:aminomethyltransferase
LLARLSPTSNAETAARLGGLAPDSWFALDIAGVAIVAARFGWSGEDAFQLFVPAESAAAVVALLRTGDRESRLVPCSMDALEVLRIEAGVPVLGAELGDEIFPDEARLDRAVSRTKGCYTGQEIVARLYSRGAVNHLLVGLRFDAATPPAVGTALVGSGRSAGEITSACTSPSLGAIGLGYARREHAEVGAVLDASGVRAEVAPLPLFDPAHSRASAESGAFRSPPTAAGKRSP